MNSVGSHAVLDGVRTLLLISKGEMGEEDEKQLFFIVGVTGLLKTCPSPIRPIL